MKRKLFFLLTVIVMAAAPFIVPVKTGRLVMTEFRRDDSAADGFGIAAEYNCVVARRGNTAAVWTRRALADGEMEELAAALAEKYAELLKCDFFFVSSAVPRGLEVPCGISFDAAGGYAESDGCLDAVYSGRFERDR